MNNIHIYPDTDLLIEAAAQRWITIAQKAIDRHSCFHVALSGGGTPAALHRRLGAHDLADQIDWNHVHIWFGDERCVSPEHPDSNYRMVKETLLQSISVPPDQVHRIHGETPHPPEAAQDYAVTLEKLLPKYQASPHFDLIMLGIGTDGHIASLFPNSDNLKERQASTSAAWIDTQKGWRISLTSPVIREASHIMLLATGENKANILEQVLNGSSNTNELPAMLIKDLPQTEWFLDNLAAGLLQSP